MEKLFYATVGANVAAAERLQDLYKEIFTDFSATYATWAAKGAEFLAENNLVPEQLREQWKANAERVREQWEGAVSAPTPRATKKAA